MHVVLRYEQLVVGDVPFYLKFWTKVTPPPFTTAISNLYSQVKCNTERNLTDLDFTCRPIFNVLCFMTIMLSSFCPFLVFIVYAC